MPPATTAPARRTLARKEKGKDERDGESERERTEEERLARHQTREPEQEQVTGSRRDMNRRAEPVQKARGSCSA